jgi:hypothetical protein
MCKDIYSQVQWLKPVMLATLEVEIRRIVVQGQYMENISETSS